MRTINQYGTTKLIGPNDTAIFTQSEIPSRGLVSLFIGLRKSGAGLSDIALEQGELKRIRVKAANRPIIDVPAERWIAYLERFSMSSKTYGESPVTHAADDFSYHFPIPLHFLDDDDEDVQDLCQFPANAPLTLELISGANMETDTQVSVGWMTTDAEPAFFPLVLNQKLNFGASATRQRAEIFQDGVLRGIGIPYAHLARLELWQDGDLKFDMSGLGSSSFPCNMIAESQGVSAPYPNDVISNGDHIFLKDGFDNGIPIRRGEGTVLFADTGSSWPTSGPDDEVSVYSVVPIRSAA